MSSEEATSPLTKLVPGMTLIALIVSIASAIFHVATLQEPKAPTFLREKAPPQTDYSNNSGWYIKPDTRPDGGWARPWGIDLFWMSNTNPSFKGGWNAPADWSGNLAEFEKDSSWIEDVSKETPVYSPRLRSAAQLRGTEFDAQSASSLESEDLFASFDHYTTTDNRFRGIMVGGSGNGSALAATLFEQRIENSPNLSNRFGIAILKNPSSDTLSVFDSLPECSLDKADFPCLLNADDMTAQELATQVSLLAQSFSIWLDANTAKPAAPLAPMEFIDIAPINKPDGQ